MKKNKISVEQVMKLEGVINYLEELLKGFKQGKIVVEHEDKVIVMTPPELVEVEVEVKQKPDKEKFCLELSWRPELVESKDEAPLKISQQEPPTMPASQEKKEEEATTPVTSTTTSQSNKSTTPCSGSKTTCSSQKTATTCSKPTTASSSTKTTSATKSSSTATNKAGGAKK